MPSTRRPRYNAGTRAPGASSPQPEGGRTDVISASKSADAGKTAAAGGSRTAAEARPGKSSAAPPDNTLDNFAPDNSLDNVLSFPEPKARRRKRILLGTAGILAVLMAGIIAAAVYSPVLALHTVTVDGTRMLSTEQIQAALAPLQGKPLPQISDADVTALLQPLVQVKAATTQARPPSGLHVHVTERVPVALVRQGTAFQVVDVDGIQLSTTTDPASIPLPVIDGGVGTLPKDLFQAITAVLGALPADILARLSDASAKSVDAVELQLVDGQTIVWGNAGEKELKARVLAALLKVPADPKNPVRVYDVSVPRHPVTR
ncbi:cell division protein FtsQ/DivIB [Pseudarthrobacter albicanus]|uniref:cell division protein FtsQ/DivIB n=1 Tax=Pseudarthrobacter albicanus TaxID=2823873 RepID=UPI0027DB5A1B|nr:FtsQ-type POTRA domain-containing protein [Pseudarthrobacter albicanus]